MSLQPCPKATRGCRARAASAVLRSLLAVLLAAGPGAGAMAQGDPFSVNGEAGDAAAGEAVPQAEPRASLPTRRGPAMPFDVNGDGFTPPAELPTDEPEIVRPSTTVSPLANGRLTPNVVAVDAGTRDQRRGLSALLRETTDSVRELRVNLAGQPFGEALVDRPVIPARRLRLEGEVDAAAFTVFLTSAEASRGGTLSVALTNSVLVLPEASRMRVLLNGRQIAQTAIDSPDRTKVIALPIPADLLRAGENALRFEAQMRHRIDCSLDATFELWAEVDTRLTGFSYPQGRMPLLGLNEIAATGVTSAGATRLRVVQPRPSEPASIARMLSAVQALALRGRFAQPLVEVANGAPLAAAGPGALTLAIGTYDGLRTLIEGVPEEGALGPLASLSSNGEAGPTVFVTGPDEAAVDAALARLAPSGPARAAGPLGGAAPWQAPRAIAVEPLRSVSLREAGVETINFSGRRFGARFRVALPHDFYAAAYGEAKLYLDAAYASDVEPGSRLSVFVNDVLSTAISFTSRDGEVFEDLPIVLSMASFRPGTNEIEIIADLETEADQACLPGGTVPVRDRFALFSSSRLEFPQFARIGQVPSLASFATNGFPYQRAEEPLSVMVGSGSLDTIAAAGTTLARMAVSRGAVFQTAVVEDVAAVTAAPLLVVAPLSEVPSYVLEVTDVGRTVPASWLEPFPATGGAAPEGLERYDDVLRRLRQQLRQDDTALSAAAPDQSAPAPAADEARPTNEFAADQSRETQRSQQRWFEELEEDDGLAHLIASVLGALRDGLSFGLGPDEGADGGTLSTPLAQDTTLIIAQNPAPKDDDDAWTLVTAPTPALLSGSLAGLTTDRAWSSLAGRMSAYELATGTVRTVGTDRVSYIATSPLSFANMRLIAANWFSLHNGYYAVLMIVLAGLLGLFTWLLLVPFGRPRR